MLVDLHFVNLSHTKCIDELIGGQIEALENAGIKGVIFSKIDYLVYPEAYAVLAFNSEKKLVGGARIYQRSLEKVLPLEHDESYLPEEFRKYITEKKNFFELRGLWVAKEYIGNDLGKEITRKCIENAYKLGAAGIVATGQKRTYEYYGKYFNFEIDSRIPPFPFPDKRFETVVAFHKKENW
ncbi:GNAT family N-acetyltransferase [Pigmentibacter sp. JX0631]|uniref:GNAT family N-acetyltransferase n=1 Tax=Pigmentibacter sp. JX0631 TaxID=2976982 RepID=UPI002469923B|nr:GNAT family N-acetyltransferase [Pigmentibacter sp. JX0631]WGL60134.1 GNAT family N-acetyltransferase [Pigmentibacter sp. JX0631]